MTSWRCKSQLGGGNQFLAWLRPISAGDRRTGARYDSLAEPIHMLIAKMDGSDRRVRQIPLGAGTFRQRRFPLPKRIRQAVQHLRIERDSIE